MESVILILLFVIVIALCIWSSNGERGTRPTDHIDYESDEKIYLDNKWWR